MSQYDGASLSTQTTELAMSSQAHVAIEFLLEELLGHPYSKKKLCLAKDENNSCDEHTVGILLEPDVHVEKCFESSEAVLGGRELPVLQNVWEKS